MGLLRSGWSIDNKEDGNQELLQIIEQKTNLLGNTVDDPKLGRAHYAGLESQLKKQALLVWIVCSIGGCHTL